MFVQAGLRPRHIVRLVDTSRVSASHWLSGKTHPDLTRFPLLASVQRVVAQALTDGELPVSTKILAEERNVRLLAIIRRRLRDLS